MSTLLSAAEAGVLTLTLNRPEARNALEVATYRALVAALAAADRDPAVRSVIITGTGGHFTAGNDLKDFMSPEGAPAAFELIQALPRVEKPLLAAVEGR